MKHFTAADLPGLEQRYRTNLINSITGFKPVSLVGTISRDGITNLAVFSQVFHIGADPALIGLLVRPHTTPRHTLENIERTGYFTLNHIRAEFLHEAHHTSARWNESEFYACGLSPWFSKKFKAPYVEEAQVRLGLKLEETHTLAINNTIMVIGSLQEIWLPENCLGADGFVDLEAAGSLTSSGLDAYHTTQKVARLPYAKPDFSQKASKHAQRNTVISS